jgi:hypothetical protein
MSRRPKRIPKKTKAARASLFSEIRQHHRSEEESEISTAAAEALHGLHNNKTNTTTKRRSSGSIQDLSASNSTNSCSLQSILAAYDDTATISKRRSQSANNYKSNKDRPSKDAGDAQQTEDSESIGSEDSALSAGDEPQSRDPTNHPPAQQQHYVGAFPKRKSCLSEHKTTTASAKTENVRSKRRPRKRQITDKRLNYRKRARTSSTKPSSTKPTAHAWALPSSDEHSFDSARKDESSGSNYPLNLADGDTTKQRARQTKAVEKPHRNNNSVILSNHTNDVTAKDDNNDDDDKSASLARVLLRTRILIITIFSRSSGLFLF